MTGEEKADWFVRVNGAGAYPRPELVAEYRKFSEGKNIRLVSLHEILTEMEAPQDFVSEIQLAENTANTAYRRSENTRLGLELANSAVSTNPNLVFDFVLRYGGGNITFASDGAIFTFEVSEFSQDSLWAYPNSANSLYRVVNGNMGEVIGVDNLQRAAEPFAVNRGEVICARDLRGNTLVARLVGANQPAQNEQFRVSFAYSIYKSGDEIRIP